MRLKYLKNVTAGVLLLFAVSGHCVIDMQTALIERTLADSSSFGKCMLFSLSFQPANSCPGNWVSLDCDGNYHSKADGNRMWDSAQLALALNLRVRVWINDAKKINGYCVADRLDILK